LKVEFEMSSGQNETHPLDDMGLIDWVVIDSLGRRTSGEALPLVVDLVDRGLSGLSTWHL
jgi:hypothetical protein